MLELDKMVLVTSREQSVHLCVVSMYLYYVKLAGKKLIFLSYYCVFAPVPLASAISIIDNVLQVLFKKQIRFKNLIMFQ